MFNAISRIALVVAFNVIGRQIAKIDDVLIRAYVERNVQEPQNILLKLVDDNPNNREQVQQYWSERDEIIFDDLLNTSADLVERDVKNELLREQVSLLLRSVADLELFGDNDNDDTDLPATTKKALMSDHDKLMALNDLMKGISETIDQAVDESIA